MRIYMKVAVAVAGVLAGTGLANAAAVQPNTGNSNLLFFVTDTTSNLTYTDVFTQDLNSYFSTAQATSPAPTNGVLNTINGDANFTVDLSGDTNLTGFLSSAGAHPLLWGVIAGGYTGGTGSGQRPVGKARYIGTSDSSALGVSEGQIVSAMATGLNNDVTLLNTNLGAGSSTQQGVFGTTASAGGTVLNFYGGGLLLGSAIGASTTLYGITGNGSGAGAGDAYSLGTASFAGDVFTFTGNGTAPVPLPAAVWLFGSGLLGLAGIGRRRNANLV